MNEWKKDFEYGYFYLNNGISYINNDFRYPIAFRFLKSSYDKLLISNPNNHIMLARICLQIGISINENMTIINHIERNNRAIMYYKLGLKHLNMSPIDDPIIKMSLYNSIAVAYHHKDYSHIPPVSYKYYKKAFEIYKTNPKNKQIIDIMKRVEHNSSYKFLIKKGGYHCNNHNNIKNNKLFNYII